jgi:hypothetical protein
MPTWSDDPSRGSTSAADRLHPAHPDAAPIMAVEPEADGVHAPVVDAMTVEVVEEIEGPVTAGGVGAIEAVPRLLAPAAAHRQPRGFVLHELQGTAARRRSGASMGCGAIRVTRPDRWASRCFGGPARRRERRVGRASTPGISRESAFATTPPRRHRLPDWPGYSNETEGSTLRVPSPGLTRTA